MATAKRNKGEMEEQEAEVETHVKDWMQIKLQEAIKKLRVINPMVIEMPVKNMGIVVDGNDIWNRIEVNTGFDFDTIDQVMVSEAMESCPLKKNYVYVTVLLAKPTPCRGSAILALPFMYDLSSFAGNDLQKWILINNKLKRTEFRIDFAQGT